MARNGEENKKAKNEKRKNEKWNETGQKWNKYDAKQIV